MKTKALADIKHGQRVYDLLPLAYCDICRLTGLDKHTAQKVLANLAKHGYIMKMDEVRDLWVRI